MSFGPFQTSFLLLRGQERLFATYIRLQATVGKPFSDRFGNHIWETEPLEVGNIVCLGTSKHSSSKTNVTGGEFAGATGFRLHMVVVLRLGMLVNNAIDSGPVNANYFPNLQVQEAGCFKVDNACLLGG